MYTLSFVVESAGSKFVPVTYGFLPVLEGLFFSFERKKEEGLFCWAVSGAFRSLLTLEVITTYSDSSANRFSDRGRAQAI